MTTFEDDLKRLEALTAAIKQSDISLEDALKDFEEGIKLAKGMEKQLDAIESKIQILMNAPEDATPDEAGATDGEGKAKAKKPRAKKDSSSGPALDLFTIPAETIGTRNA